jgi:MoaA/NifB/PqqE/SkfB family radical SAM enzyme
MMNEILATLDINTYSSLKDLYTDLLSLKRDVFLDHTRIVLIYSSDNQKKLLTQLITVIDIPEFFVIFQKSDSNKLGYLDFSFSDSHCVYAWCNMEIRNDGSFSPCCRFDGHILNDQGQALTIQNSNIEEAYLSAFMQDLRKDLLEGKKPKTCNYCWVNEKGNNKNKNSSLRYVGNHKFKDVYYILDYKKEDVNNIRSLDLKLGNTCNLSCRICNPVPSSKIASMDLTVGRLTLKDFKKISRATKWATTDEFWHQFLPIAQNLTSIDIVGGEPFLVKPHYNFVAKLIELGLAKNITMNYESNGTIYADEYIEQWKHFKAVKVGFSVDDMNERFEYQRNGAIWESVVENIKKYSSLRFENLSLEIYPTINIQNVYYLPELLEWALTMNVDTISYGFLHGPEYLSIENLTEEAKKLVIDKLLPYQDRYEMIDATINKIKNSKPIQTDFLKQMQSRDAERGQNFAAHHSDIAKAMGYT